MKIDKHEAVSCEKDSRCGRKRVTDSLPSINDELSALLLLDLLVLLFYIDDVLPLRRRC